MIAGSTKQAVVTKASSPKILSLRYHLDASKLKTSEVTNFLATTECMPAMKPFTSKMNTISGFSPGGAIRLPGKLAPSAQSLETCTHPALLASSTVLGWSLNPCKGVGPHVVFKLYQVCSA